jgi:hypothetical protein
VTPLDKPVISCTATPNDGVTAPYTLNCTVTSPTYEAGDVMHWFLDGSDFGDGQVTDLGLHTVRLEVTRTGTDPVWSDTLSGSSGSW